MQVPDPDASIDPARRTEASLRSQMVAKHLDGLPEQQKIAIRLKFIEGYKIAEVAKLMGLAEGTIKSHIFRGLARLRVTMGKEIEDEL